MEATLIEGIAVGLNVVCGRGNGAGGTKVGLEASSGGSGGPWRLTINVDEATATGPAGQITRCELSLWRNRATAIRLGKIKIGKTREYRI